MYQNDKVQYKQAARRQEETRQDEIAICIITFQKNMYTREDRIIRIATEDRV